jgi:hypothetical protein
MTTFAPARVDDEHSLAVLRLDDDLAAAAATEELHALRRRALAAYQAALEYAGGKPDDPHWRILAHTVATFVARVPEGARSHRVAKAMARLHALVRENLS